MAHVTRGLLAAILAALCSLFAGCVLTQLEVGFDLAKPAPYVLIKVGEKASVTPNAPIPVTVDASGEITIVPGQGGAAPGPAH